MLVLFLLKDDLSESKLGSSASAGYEDTGMIALFLSVMYMRK